MKLYLLHDRVLAWPLRDREITFKIVSGWERDQGKYRMVGMVIFQAIGTRKKHITGVKKAEIEMPIPILWLGLYVLSILRELLQNLSMNTFWNLVRLSCFNLPPNTAPLLYHRTAKRNEKVRWSERNGAMSETRQREIQRMSHFVVRLRLHFKLFSYCIPSDNIVLRRRHTVLWSAVKWHAGLS